jgi:heme oxygenase (biliverdin-IX-beta and delta-forming)
MILDSTPSSNPPAASVLERLKRETRAHHEAVERQVDLSVRCTTLGGYVDVLLAMRDVYAVVEPALARLDWSPSGLVFEERAKSPLLRADLAALGVDAHTHTAHLAFDAPRSLAAGFGCLYVLEGATLGGQLIARVVARALDLGPTTGASFFASYGARVGAMWQAFGRAATATCVTPSEIDEAVGAAAATFEVFRARLGELAVAHARGGAP